MKKILLRILFFMIVPAVLTGFGVAVEENNQNLMMRLESTAEISSTVSLSNNDEFAIETAEKYPSAYRATTNQARTEQSAQARPELSTHVSNWEDYGTVILIYPCWWSGLPMPVYTFLEEYDFTGKTVLPLCTHEGSGMGSTQRELEDACPGATVLTGLTVRGGSVSGAAANVENWLHDAGIFA